MCCRYFVELSPELRPIIEAARDSHLAGEMVANLGKKFKAEGEIRPTDMAAVIAPDKEGRRKPYPMVWGFSVPGLKSPLLNARVESAASKPTFKECWKRRRCVIPASYYFEWLHYEEHGKMRTGDRYAISPRGAEITWLAGLYRIEEGYAGFRYPVFTVLTREPVPELRRIHNRMPVVLPEDVLKDWIHPGTKPSVISEIIETRTQLAMIAEKQ
jgi:putative SOS response-associated peptidase YedK